MVFVFQDLMYDTTELIQMEILWILLVEPLYSSLLARFLGPGIPEEAPVGELPNDVGWDG